MPDPFGVPPSDDEGPDDKPGDATRLPARMNPPRMVTGS